MAVMTSPAGTFLSLRSCGLPHTPTGKPPVVTLRRKPPILSVPSAARISFTVRAVFALAVPTGAMPRAWLGNGAPGPAPSATNCWVGTVVVRLSSNSL